MSQRKPKREGRNRERTAESLLVALKGQILEEGILRTGINSVAARAGVSKELIYRYFGGMDGLILEMMSREDYWTRSRDIPASPNDRESAPADEVRRMLQDQLGLLLASPIVQEVRRWELIEPDDTRQKLAKRRESLARAFITRISEKDGESEMDIPAVTAIMLAGILYLVLRSKTEDQFLGVPLNDPAGWDRVRDAIDYLVDRAFPDMQQPSDRDCQRERDDPDDNGE